MERERIKYCQWQKGILYFAVKGPDGKTSYTPLPNPSAPTFAKLYDGLKQAHEAAKVDRAKKRGDDSDDDSSESGYISGSWRALVREFERSQIYRAQDKATKRSTDRYTAMFVREMGDQLVSRFDAADLDRRLDEPDLAEFPGKALNYIKTMQSVIDLGIRRNYRKDKYNPARGATMPQTGEYVPWPDAVYEDVLAHAAPVIALAIKLGVYTGQRISDCILMQRSALLTAAETGEPMHLVQKKTGVDVYIPIHPDLADAVRAWPESAMADTVLYNRAGRAFPDPGQLQDRLKLLMTALGYVKTITQAGENRVVTLYKFHGLRKLSSCHLVEAGATHHEVSAINGMDIQTVIHYTRGVEKKKLSRGFADRMNAIRPGQERPEYTGSNS